MYSTQLIRCLILNLAALFASGALFLSYPKEGGFTVSSGGQTHYYHGGVLLGAALICISDVAIAAYLG